LLRLPEPSPGDLYLDFEGDPYAHGGDGREYLAGIWNRQGEFTTFWAHSFAEEHDLTRDLLAHLIAALDADPGMHVYHYAPYERTALQRLTQRHGVGETDLDRLFRAECLVDLYAVVRQGLRISKGSYSIKKLEAFYWGGIRGSGDQPDDVADALASVVAYERWLATGREDQQILDNIASYNRDDVRSTHDLHAWLEQRRTELESQHGAQPRPGPVEAKTTATTATELAEIALADELREAGHPLLASLIGWHRREAKPQWWDFFRLSELTDDELVRDRAALGGLSAPVLIGPEKRSFRWRYTFAAQEVRGGDEAYDVDTHEQVGTVLDLDPVAGVLDIKVGPNKQPVHPRAFALNRPVNTTAQRESLARTARAVLAGDRPLAQLLLDHVAPPDLAPRPAETPSDVVVRVGTTLRDAVLPVQGPPGAGKTWTGARLIRALLDSGCRVGVTAQSHAVIANLLKAVERPALHRCDNDNRYLADGIDFAKDNDVVLTAMRDDTHRLIGGTAWLWAREDLLDAVDVLVIDEAGQFSLANAAAVAPAARGLVLLGDPQQLTQPTQALHPDGANVSALEYLLDGAATVPPDRGVFLDRTFRMHPDLTAVVSRLMYEDRLLAATGTEQQTLDAPAPWAGTGIRWVPVSHTGNESTAPEEVTAVGEIVAQLLTGTWVAADGTAHPMTPADVLVVAPYNAHVARLRAALPDDIRIGTVDKFQGQEAPAVIYSMASSSAAAAPRGIDFLYDTHRLNVAISRARCLAIVVASPALLDALARTPAQLRAVNGLITMAQAEIASPLIRVVGRTRDHGRG
jgi:uncharacterized protein